MSDLHPSARALIDAARGREGSLPPEVRSRVHRSVLRRAVALGVAVATTSTASAASKAAALVAMWTSPLAIPGVVGAVAGVAFLVFRVVSSPTEAPISGPAAPTHAVARSVPSAAPSIEARPAIAQPEPSTVSPEPAPSTTNVAALAATPTPLPLDARLSPAPAFRRQPAAAAPVPAEAAGDTGEPSTARATDEPLRASPATPTSAAGVRAVPPAADLAGDLDLLHQVHAALRQGRGEAALSLLDRAGRGLEAGPLAEEAQVARVSALCQLGRAADARTATDRFLAAWPTSPLAGRLRGGCAALGVNSNRPGD